MKIQKVLISIVTAIALIAVSLWIGEWAYSWLPPQAAAESQLVDNYLVLNYVGSIYLRWSYSYASLLSNFPSSR